MKVAVTSTGDNLESQLDPRFGRCQYFVLVDSESMDFEAIPNESMDAMGGAGIQAAQNVANSDAETVITGNMGPNAYQTLSAANIKVITGASGTIKEVMKKFQNGELKATSEPNVDNHFGMGGSGRASGRGMGRGGGGGKGRGGGGGGRGQGIRKLD